MTSITISKSSNGWDIYRENGRGRELLASAILCHLAIAWVYDAYKPLDVHLSIDCKGGE